MKTAGIDVSNHQGEIDWSAVVAHCGIKFAFIKASEGGTYQDKFYARNVSLARAAGLLTGPYHFFRPRGPVSLQVENFLNVLNSAETTDLPPVLDLETPGEWGQFTVSQRVELVTEFLTSVKSKLGRSPIIYMSASFSRDVLAEASMLIDYKLWVAHYTTAPEPWVPAPWANWTFWQHTDKGTINGIKGNVDLDWFNGSLEQLR